MPWQDDLTNQIIVKDELVAVRHQQIRGRALDAHTDHHLVVLPELGHQRRKVGITADDHEGIDMRLGVAQVQGIDHHADVGRVLA
jgi:hypothetical protein